MSTRNVGLSLREAVRRNADGIAARTLTADGQQVTTEASAYGRMRSLFLYIRGIVLYTEYTTCDWDIPMCTYAYSSSSQICHVSTLPLSREKGV